MRVQRSSPAVNTHTEAGLTRVMIVVTFLGSLLFAIDAVRRIIGDMSRGHSWSVAQYVAVGFAYAFPIYGSLIYQFTRLGYLKRRGNHRPATPGQLEHFAYTDEAPTLTVLIPSYKEEQRIICQTVLSAALQHYPRRRVVLLIDDPYTSPDPGDQRHLAATRQLIRDLHNALAEPAAYLAAAQREYLAQRANGQILRTQATERLAAGYSHAAEWLSSYARTFTTDDHTDQFFLAQLIDQPCATYRQRAAELRALVAQERPLTERQLTREYASLASLFAVEIASFERKKYANLSHEANKAMNLNSYIALLGQAWREQPSEHGLLLVAATNAEADLIIPATDYLITLDADSLILPGYALRLIHFMEQPANARVAVAQTPYSAIPQAAHPVERIAGATTDIQYLVHQGLTYFNATFWVGANALIRKVALDEVGVVERENGWPITRYIQDRTVIEDTESTIDLLHRGWRLYNYPERLAYSATPPDFGALLIQRRRWANGGLIIFPKLVRYLRDARQRGWLAEGLARTHYLTSLSGASIGMLLILSLPPQVTLLSAWLPLTALPYHLLYYRDLKALGYRGSDLLRIYGLNLLLIPINLGGVLKSLQQGLTGAKIPFGRTPKVSNRTSAPALYILAEYALCGVLLYTSVLGVMIRQWGLFVFAFANFLILAYSIVRFIGLRASLEDLTLATRERLAGRVRADALRPTLALRQPMLDEKGPTLEPQIAYATIDLSQWS